MTCPGDSLDRENCRLFACDLIQNAGILLKLPQAVLTTAQMLLQRVYHTDEYTLDRHPLDITSMAALLLGTKVEESRRKVRDVIDVLTFVIATKLKRKIVLNHGEHERVRKELFNAEKIMLKTLGFNLLSSYPHKILVNYYHAIVHYLDPEKNVWRERDNQRVLQRAWNYCNDSLRLDVFVKYSQVVVVCACIQMACEDIGMMFPKSTEGLNWYSLFVKDEQEVIAVIEVIRSFYDRDAVDAKAMTKYIYLVANLHTRS